MNNSWTTTSSTLSNQPTGDQRVSSGAVMTERSKPTPGHTFSVTFQNQPWRNRKFIVRGICKHDVLNPCWDNRPDDKPGEHWGGGPACAPCTRAARAQGGAA